MVKQNKEIVIWAESEAEAQEFLLFVGTNAEFSITKIYVAKKSGGKRDVGHLYLKGIYFPYDIEKKAVINSPIKAPVFIVDLVQWCSPDIIISTKKHALICLELTFHILTFNNIAQRIPRMVRGSSLGIPSVIFQKVDYRMETINSWFVKTFAKATKIYKTPCLALLFSDDEYGDARKMLVRSVNKIVNNPSDKDAFEAIEKKMAPLEGLFDENTILVGKNGNNRKWIEVDSKNVIVSIGVRDNCALKGIEGFGCQGDDASKIAFRKQLKNRPLGTKGCVWLSKGTGGMDPYPGLVKMSEILFCFDNSGNRTKKLICKFSNLPKNFWWFKKNTEEIYFKLVNSFSDEVRYSLTFK